MLLMYREVRSVFFSKAGTRVDFLKNFLWSTFARSWLLMKTRIIVWKAYAVIQNASYG